MSKADAIQTAINRASLTMNVSEDVAKAVKVAEIHPSLATVLMRMHEAQMQAERDLREIRSQLLELARVLSTSADVTATTHVAIAAIADKLNIPMNNLFSAEEPDD